MNATETFPNPASATPIAAPDAAPATNAQPAAVGVLQAQPDTGATPPEASSPNSSPAGDTDSPKHPGGPNWVRRLRPQYPLVGLRMAEPCVSDHDLRVEASLKVTSRDGTVVHVPVCTTLSGTLSPAFIPLAQLQFESVLENLLVTPAKVAFISFLEDLKSARKDEAEKAKQAQAAEQAKEQEALRAQLNGKVTP